MRTAILTVLASAVMFAQDGKTQLKVGDMAPDFKVPASNGKTISLSDYKGQKNVVLSFFPLAFTGGCTQEMKGHQAAIAKFGAAETQVFGMSVDAAPSLRVFAEQLSLEFPLLSDFPKKEVSKAYGVLMEDRGIASRTTFVIDKTGKITDIIFDPKAAPHNDGAVQACERLSKKS